MREAPREKKSRYAFLGALGVTAIVFVFWGASLPARFKTYDTAPAADTVQEATDEAGGFSDLFQSARSQLGALAESFQTVSNESASTTATSSNATLPPIPTSGGNGTTITFDEPFIADKPTPRDLATTTADTAEKVE